MQKPSKQTVVRLGIWAGIIAVCALLGPRVILDVEYWYQIWREHSAVIGPDNPPSAENFDPVDAVPEQPAITDFKILPAGEIIDEIRDDELILGVVIEGEARAYSINMMTGPEREIFNDVLAGRPIAATW